MTDRPPVDLWTLRIFLEVAETRSMTDAARRLGITQSAVSQAVRKLEAELGTALLHPRQRPVAPTPAGLVLERHAAALVRDAMQLPGILRTANSDPTREIRLGMVDTFASTAGPELVRELTGTANRVVIWSGLAPSLGAALTAREVDAIVTSDPLDHLDGLDRFPLWQEPFVVLLPRRGRPYPTGSLSELAVALPLVRYSARSHTGATVERHLRRIGLAPEKRIEVDGSDTLVAMVAAGIGWAVATPLCLLQGAAHALEVEAVAMPRPGLGRTVSLMWRQDRPCALAAHTAIVARRVLREHCLPRLHGLAPHLTPLVAIDNTEQA